MKRTICKKKQLKWPPKIGMKATSKCQYGNICIGDKLEITGLGGCPPVRSSGNWNVNVIDKSNGCSSGIPFSYLYALAQTREEEIKDLKDEEKDLLKQIKKIKEEIVFLTKYKDEEDYLAHQLIDILANKGDVEAVREILKRRTTHLL